MRRTFTITVERDDFANEELGDFFTVVPQVLADWVAKLADADEFPLNGSCSHKVERCRMKWTTTSQDTNH